MVPFLFVNIPSSDIESISGSQSTCWEKPMTQCFLFKEYVLTSIIEDKSDLQKPLLRIQNMTFPETIKNTPATQITVENYYK